MDSPRPERRPRWLRVAGGLLAEADLPTLRRVLTLLVRAERHSGGGWLESAFESGMAQAATTRLGELAAER